MKHALVLVLASMSFLPAVAMAGDEYDQKHAGHKGYVSAYDSDMSTIIDVERCPTRGKLSTPDYVACGQPFRDKIKATVCRQKGAGKHTWYDQVGDAKKNSNTAFCK
jgi:hypothetical protein